MRKIITVFSIITLFCSCSSTKEATTAKPEAQEKPAPPKNINNYPVM
ncbi:MAG: hypothetical protein QNK84_02685 [Flavobacteriales bacterium]